MTEMQARLQQVIVRYVPYAPAGMGVLLKSYLPGIIARMDDEAILKMLQEVRGLTEFVLNGNVEPGKEPPGGYGVGKAECHIAK